MMATSERQRAVNLAQAAFDNDGTSYVVIRHHSESKWLAMPETEWIEYPWANAADESTPWSGRIYEGEEWFPVLYTGLEEDE